VDGAAFADRLAAHGFDFFAGVPCSLLEDLIAVLERDPRRPWIAAVREDVAVGMAGGAWFGGRRPAVLMQNSGLGTSLNALASFSLMYGLPTLLVVTWRGYGGRDAPEHILTGAITPGLLDLLGIPHRTIARESLDADLAWAAREMDARMSPVALLLPPGILAGKPRAQPPGAAAGSSARPATVPPGAGPDRLEPRISRLQAITAAVKQLGDELVVHCNGYPSRESFSVADRARNFYMIGSMGLACAIGVGLALARPDRRTVVFDGDGNLLMSLGILANVAALAPHNLVHCVFDNEAYGSTGNQRSVAAHVRLDRVAAAAGYRSVAAATEPEAVAAELSRMLRAEGPHFLLVKVTREEADVPRIPHTPRALRDRFRDSVLAP
jgi:phosphonopyruvate decarboxylase